MRFENYNEFEDKQYNILDINGQITLPEDLPSLNDEQLVYLYKTMIYSRIIDEKALSYQRQGRMLTYAPNIGQEAAQVGSAYAMEEDDWLVPSFRELGALLIRGVPLEKIYLYWYGNEFGSHLEADMKVLPVSVPISSQFQHATGIGMANNIKKENNVVVTYVGDGGTSHGDFHEALNFASVFKVPVVFIVQNNQYAISLPRHRQTASKTIAQKAVAYGMPGILVDGNDIFAMYSATKEAINRARNGEGPTLIEAYTYRLGAHTTSDDPTKYREDAEVEEWKEKDPILRFKKYLLAKGLINDEWEEKIKKELNDKVGKIFEEIEGKSDTEIEDIFKYQYETMPPQLEEQLEDYKEFLEGGQK
ncbi:MAG TPA: pyruvate dehydrogenase (acetyl-transferring) E1 component subunit alpha [Tissierellales bacterium]|nr:pyruvate dehydrogenase (acetyl-transferring) E1 component subunit alpha [Tissierellales bacterium]